MYCTAGLLKLLSSTAGVITVEPVPALVPHSSSPHDERASLLPSSDSEVVSIQQPPMTTKIRILLYTFVDESCLLYQDNFLLKDML